MVNSSISPDLTANDLSCPSCRASLDPGAKYCPFCGTMVKLAIGTADSLVKDKCPNCNEPRSGKFCCSCGYQFFAEVEIPVPSMAAYATMARQKQTSGRMDSPARPLAKPVNRVTAGMLALFLGTFGAQKFYMGKTGAGIVCILFCWTAIPTIIGIVEGIIYLLSSDTGFHRKLGT
jgi:hypothetical protein